MKTDTLTLASQPCLIKMATKELGTNLTSEDLHHEIDFLEREISALERLKTQRQGRSLGVERLASASTLGTWSASMTDGEFETRMTSEISGLWELQQHSTHLLRDNNIFVQKTRWTHPDLADQLDAVSIHLTFAKKGSNEEIELRSLDIGLLDNPLRNRQKFHSQELDGLILHCKKTCNPSLFFLMLENFIHKYRTRWATVTSDDFRANTQELPGNFAYRVESQRSVLAKLTWKIAFSTCSMNVEDQIKVQLTEEGREQARQLNLPSEFVRSGHCPEWSAKTHLRNIIKMAASFQSSEED